MLHIARSEACGKATEFLIQALAAFCLLGPFQQSWVVDRHSLSRALVLSTWDIRRPLRLAMSPLHLCPAKTKHIYHYFYVLTARRSGDNGTCDISRYVFHDDVRTADLPAPDSRGLAVISLGDRTALPGPPDEASGSETAHGVTSWFCCIVCSSFQPSLKSRFLETADFDILSFKSVGLISSSEKQYKDRLSAWHVRKNIKAKEVHIMIRKQQKRAAQGKRTAFRVGGQQVDSRRIARFIRRYRSSWNFSVSSSSPEPGESIAFVAAV